MSFFLHVTPNMEAGDLIVGVGTLALAGFTWLVAHRTASSIEALDRPFIFVSRKDKESTACIDGNEMRFWLTNLGKGPGMVHDVELLKGADRNLFLHSDENVRAIRADTTEPVSFKRDLGDFRPLQGEELKLRIYYRSASNLGYATDSILRLVADGQFLYCGHERVDIAADQWRRRLLRRFQRPR